MHINYPCPCQSVIDGVALIKVFSTITRIAVTALSSDFEYEVISQSQQQSSICMCMPFTESFRYQQAGMALTNSRVEIRRKVCTAHELIASHINRRHVYLHASSVMCRCANSRPTNGIGMTACKHQHNSPVNHQYKQQQQEEHTKWIAVMAGRMLMFEAGTLQESTYNAAVQINVRAMIASLC